MTAEGRTAGLAARVPSRLPSRVPWRGLVAVVLLGAVVWRTGSGPWLTGVRALDARTVAACAGIAALTTTACAWRWHLVARQLGLRISVRQAVVGCYRSQFLNTVLPGGVLGDVVRGALHGRDVGDTRRALRAVAWERCLGQVVTVVLGLALLAVLPSPVRTAVPVAAALGVVAVVVAGLVALRRRAGRRAVPAWWSGPDRATWPGVVVASAVATAGHVTTFLVVARAVGVDAPWPALLPLAVVALLAAGLPLNVAGWGPREGAAGWVFAAAGLGAGPGVATAVAYGVVVLVASLPGALLLARSRTTAVRGVGRD